jgi:hypothetical protein
MSLKRLFSALTAVLVVITALPAATDALGNSKDVMDTNVCTFTFANGSYTCSVQTTLHGFKTKLNGQIELNSWAYSIVLATSQAKYFGWIEWHVFIRDGANWIDHGVLEYNPYDHSQTVVTAFQEDLDIRVSLKVVHGEPPAPGQSFYVEVWPSRIHPR